MRESLFRGKCIDNGAWVKGGYTRNEDDYYIVISKSVCIDQETNYWENHIDYVRVHEETIGQYTGLKDKAGTMIFEGDKYYAQKLMRHPAREHYGTYWISVQCDVVFVNGMFDGKVLTDKVHYCELVFFPSGTMGGLPKEIEITGTIHDKQGE